MMTKAPLILAISVWVAACQQETAPAAIEDDLSPQVPLKQISEPSACEAQMDSIEPSENRISGKLLYLPIIDQFAWGESEGSANSRARRLIGARDSSREDNVYQANGLTDWVELKYESDGLSEVVERHNNRSREAPFVWPYLARMKSVLGDASEVYDIRGECRAYWKTDTNEIRAVWREETEWYIEITYSEPDADEVPQVDQIDERAVWAYYISKADRDGKESALGETAREFEISREEALDIVTRGMTETWPIPQPNQP